MANIEEKINLETEKLIREYFPFYFERYKRRYKQFSQKYYSYFERAAKMFCVRDGYDAKKLIKCFLADGFKYPTQLPNEKVWSLYLEYLPNLKEEESLELILVKEIVVSLEPIKRNGTVENYLNKFGYLVKGYAMDVVPTAFAFSKAFNKFCEENNLGYNNYEKRKLVIDNVRPKVLEKLKEFLKDDYFGG